jgi:hypothetical protein
MMKGEEAGEWGLRKADWVFPEREGTRRRTRRARQGKLGEIGDEALGKGGMMAAL